MRSTSLKNIQFHRSYLAAKLLLNGNFKRLSRTGQIFVTESIGGTALSRFSDIAAVGKLNPFRNSYHNVRMLFKRGGNIGKKAVVIEYSFRKIYKIRFCSGHSCKCSGSGKPSGVTSHDLNDRYSLHGVNRAVADNFLYRSSDILCRRAEAGSMVGTHNIIVYCLWNSHYSDFIIVICRISRELGNRIHRIVPTDIEKISYIKRSEEIKKLIVNLPGSRIRTVQLWKLFAAGAKSRSRCFFKRNQFFGIGKNLGKITISTGKHSLHAVIRAVDRADIFVCKSASYYPGKRRINCSGRSAGLTDNRIASYNSHIRTP